MHKSQGFGVARRRGPILEGFQLLAEAGRPAQRPARREPFDGIDWTWRRVPGGDARDEAGRRGGARASGPTNPAASVPALVALDAALEGLSPIRLWRDMQAGRGGRAGGGLRRVCGSRPNAASPALVPGAGGARWPSPRSTARTAPVKLRRAARSPARPWPARSASRVAVGKALAAPRSPAARSVEVTAARRAPRPAGPYWLAAAAAARAASRWPTPPDRRCPRTRPRCRCEAQVEVGGRRFTLTYPVFHKWTDPVAGERTRPLEVVPAVSVGPAGQRAAVPRRQAAAAARAPQGGAASAERRRCGWRPPPASPAKPASAPFKLAAAGDEVGADLHRAAAARARRRDRRPARDRRGGRPAGELWRSGVELHRAPPHPHPDAA